MANLSIRLCSRLHHQTNYSSTGQNKALYSSRVIVADAQAYLAHLMAVQDKDSYQQTHNCGVLQRTRSGLRISCSHTPSLQP